MKFFNAALLIIAGALMIAAQKPDEVLATATGHTITMADLSPEARQAVTSLPTRIFGTRSAILDQMVNQRLLDAEAKATGSSPGKIIAAEKARVADPSEAAIKEIYDANRRALGDMTLAQARKQIVIYLRREPEQKAFAALFDRLKTKYKYIPGKGVNSSGIVPTDIVATVGQKPITAKEFEDNARIAVYELNADVGDLIAGEIEDAIFNALVADEARSLGIDAGEFIAREITNKMKDFSDAERFALETGLNKRLTEKYKVKILYKVPAPLVQAISVDDDPAAGPADAPVTIVMFSDFQCSACAATHPALKKVIDEYPGKIRFVVRDFPLESIHENAFKAALAAGAANAQGKFFEFIDILYKRQDALDTASLKKYAAEIGLNVKQFELDFNSEKMAAEIRKDIADGDAYIVNSTPTIFVNGVRVRNLSAELFRAAIEAALSK